MKKLFSAITVLCCVQMANFGAGPVRINEFVASNGSGLADDDGEFSDWIELYNESDSQVDLGEWFLTDDPADLQKWEFPSVVVPARGYLVVFASSKNRNSPKLHTSFNLSEAGEYLALVQPNAVVAEEFAPEYPVQRQNISYGLASDGTLAFFNTPTPGAPNGGGVINYVADTKFNPDRGFFDAPFDLAITTATPGATIRYTTNGVPPTAATGTVYSGPIRLSGTTTIRAAAFKTGFQPSNVDTQTYLFLDDVIRQSPTGSPPPGWPSSWGANVVDYGMDPDVVNSPRYRDTIKNDLKTIPTFSIVMRLDDLFSPTSGIYANPRSDGANWERPCSVELIHPDGTEGFQVNAGIRIRGGFSRSTDNPKHAFRLFFRAEYGDGKLEYPLFGENGASEFDKLDLRTFQNYSWSFQGDSKGIFMRDQFSRDTQLEMGHQAERGDFCHLYINGVYWGIYNTCERPEAAYGETYFGGTREDYDTIKVEPYNVEATDGNLNAWNQLYNLARTGFATTEAYQRVQGNNPDGTPNPAYPVLIDIDNLIDYMLVIIWSGNKDAPISNFLGNTNPNNFYSLRNRLLERRMGFVSFAHDAEHTLLVEDLNINRVGPFPSGDTGVSKSNPQWIFQRLWTNEEFKTRLADRIQKHFFNGGLLTPEANTARLNRRKAQLDRAVVAESARWGDSKRSSPLNRDDHWIPAVNDVLTRFFPQRTSIVLNQFRSAGLFPSVAAPSFSQQGGNVQSGSRVTINSAAGDVYYTLDGTDPRETGGGLSSKAKRYTSPVVLSDHGVLKARARSGSTWSPLNEAPFTIIREFQDLMVTELMYNPPNFGLVDGEEFEFIELKNTGTQELQLGGIRFVDGVDYIFPNGTRLAPGGFVVLVANAEQFAAKYPGVRIDGVYTNSFSNGGETITILHAAGSPIAHFTYDDQIPWPISADGGGFSLVPRELNPSLDFNNPANWRASSSEAGSPGRDDLQSNIIPVIVNEVLTHSDLPELDFVELHNPNQTAAAVGGWFLSDDTADPKKFKIPAGATIPAGGYLVFDETQFNSQPGVPPSFSFSSHGEEVVLSAADSNENLLGYNDVLRFAAAANGISFGRYTNSAGEVLFPAQLALTRGAANAGPRVGPVVINEIRYAPGPAQDEFVELKNITANTVPLYDPLRPTNTWRVGGIDFQFPEGTEIPPLGRIVIAETAPELFRLRNNLPAEVPVLGPFGGALQDNGEMIELTRPDAPDLETNNGVVTAVVPYVVVDAVRYGAQLPWPTGVMGTDLSIERKVAEAFGNDPSNWRASPGAASPGVDNDGNRLPQVEAGQNVEFVSAAFPATQTLTGQAQDDGKLNPTLVYQWSQASGPGVVQIQNASQATATFAFPGTGVYVLRFSANDGEFTVSDTVTITITRPLQDITLLPRASVWKYLDNGSNQGTAWRGLSFSDASWSSGAAPLGYGDPVTTEVSFGPNSSSKYITTYFRRAFNVSGARNIVALTGRLRRDDGVVMYLNGSEIYRVNMPPGTVDYTTTASSAIGGGDETTYFEFEIDPAGLREGNNLVAVELHQANATSSDLSFDFELAGTINASNQAPAANAGPDLTADTLNVNLNGSATDDGLPNPPGVFSATWNFLSGPGSVSFANANSLNTVASFSQGGVYQLRLSVTDGELTATDDLQVTVTAADPYVAWKQEHFTAAELGDPQISGDDADPDKDKFTNRQEFIAGTDPKDGTSYLHVTSAELEGNDFVITFEAIGDKSYSVQARDEAAAGEWQRVIDLSPQGENSIIDVLDPRNSSGRRFYRIVTPQMPVLE